MAKFTFESGDAYALKLLKLADNGSEISKKAIYEGAKIVADGIRAEIEALPEEAFRFLQGDDKLNVVTLEQKQDLLDSLGVTTIGKDKIYDWNVKIGFDGYGARKSEKYPQGLPNQLLMRAIESGSSVRKKHPVVRRAVNNTKAAAQVKMREVVDEEIRKLTE